LIASAAQPLPFAFRSAVHPRDFLLASPKLHIPHDPAPLLAFSLILFDSEFPGLGFYPLYLMMLPLTPCSHFSRTLLSPLFLSCLRLFFFFPPASFPLPWWAGKIESPYFFTDCRFVFSQLASFSFWAPSFYVCRGGSFSKFFTSINTSCTWRNATRFSTHSSSPPSLCLLTATHALRCRPAADFCYGTRRAAPPPYSLFFFHFVFLSRRLRRDAVRSPPPFLLFVSVTDGDRVHVHWQIPYVSVQLSLVRFFFFRKSPRLSYVPSPFRACSDRR